MIKTIKSVLAAIGLAVVGTLVTLYVTRDVTDSFFATAWAWATTVFWPHWLVLPLIVITLWMLTRSALDGGEIIDLRQRLRAVVDELEITKRDAAIAKQQAKEAEEAYKALEAEQHDADLLEGTGSISARPGTLADIKLAVENFPLDHTQHKTLLAVSELYAVNRSFQANAQILAEMTTIPVLETEQSLHLLMEYGFVSTVLGHGGICYRLEPPGREWLLAHR